MLHPEIIPTILTSDEADYHEKLHRIEDLVTRVQIDVMDGVFVPNTTVGASTIEAFATSLTRDVHLMVESPLSHLSEYSRLGVDYLIFHAEAVEDYAELQKVVEEIRNLGNRAGLALNLETPVSYLEKVIAGVDLVQLMSVSPGFSQQEFQPEVLPKILAVRQRYPQLPIAVDGGVDLETIGKVKEAGANLFVIGSHLFQAESVKGYLESLREKLDLR